jgi:S1-C subfamily serine protease/predicted esterase
MAWRLQVLSGTALACLLVTTVAAQKADLEDAQERLMKAAVARVSPCVVQIETSGGGELIESGPAGPIPLPSRRGTGPTTGLIIGADGYVISSAFNFANKPAAIFVAVPGHKDRYVAKAVAIDQTRMLTLLKIAATGLPVPTAAPKKGIQVGQWALALGRTWSGLDTPPSVSVGIISALGRIWGKAIQTDAKVSPVNYGGPLINLQGQVLGVLVPASPRGQDETAGWEWYDSGIGFAIPLEDINSVLPKLKQGKDLRKGILGVNLRNTDIYAAAPTIVTVAPESAAAHAGIKPGDVITEIDGVKVARQAQMLHLLGSKYEGDAVAVKVRRGKEEIGFANLKLSGPLSAFNHSFLGILPLRDDPDLGEEVRYVFPNSPSESAGLKAGDRIMKVGLAEAPLQPFSGRDELTALLDRLPPGTEVKLELNRKAEKKTETVRVTLGTFSEIVPDAISETATRGKALEPRKTARPVLEPPAAGKAPGRPAPPRRPVRRELQGNTEAKKEEKKEEKKKAATGLLKRTTAAGDHDYWAYVPLDYDPNVSYALVVWLHPAGPKKEKDKETEALIDVWEDFCSANHMILLCPRAESEAGWLGSDADFVEQTIRDIIGEYTVDRRRIIAHGMGIGGQMAFYLGFNARDLVRGVATTGAVLTNQPKENVPTQRLSFFIVAGGKDPLLQSIAETKNRLTEHRFPVVYHEIREMGHDYLDAVTLHELVRWIDSLDRQ